MKKNLGTIQAQVNATKERLNELSAALKKAEERKDRLADELVSVKRDLGALRARTSTDMRDFEEKQEEVQDLQMTINDFQQELFTAKGKIASLKDNLEMYVGLKNRYEGYSEPVRRLLSIAKTNSDIGKRIHGTVADIINTDQKYEMAISTVLGGSVHNIIVPTSSEGQYLIEYLKRTRGGSITFLPVKSMRPRPASRETQRALNERGALGLATDLVKFDEYYYNVVSNLLGNTLVCDNIANARSIGDKYGNAFRIVTLDGDIISTSGSMTGGSRSKGSSELLSHERKIQECKDEIAKQEKYVEKLTKTIAESQKEKAALEKELEEIREKHQDANSEIAALTQRETALTQQIAEAETDIIRSEGAHV